jgi:palmitoyl-protein thioesterase
MRSLTARLAAVIIPGLRAGVYAYTHPSPLPLPLPLPLVIWHGLGDNYKADGLAAVGELAARVHPGTFVYNIHLDDDPASDRTATYFGNTTIQVQHVCSALASHPVLSRAPAIDGLGFSQGGQLLRAYVQRCNQPPVRSLVTFGSQHNGIADFRNCPPTDWLCRGAFGLLKRSTWSNFVQSHVVPAQYYRDPEQLDAYLEHSNFLADLNNERTVKNETYKKNLMQLEKFAMYMFLDDNMVIPKESAWFAEVNRTTKEVTLLKDRDIYREDWLGLKAMDAIGKLDFVVTDGEHMHLTDSILNSTFSKYFGPPRATDGSGSMNFEL